VVAYYLLQSRHENAAALPREMEFRAVTSDQFQIFEVALEKRRRRWLWRVFTTDGDAIIEGSESSRPAAKYNANRALFLLLLSAPYRSNPAPFGPLRDHGSSAKSG
jgi:hypothetical protein